MNHPAVTEAGNQRPTRVCRPGKAAIDMRLWAGFNKAKPVTRVDRLALSCLLILLGTCLFVLVFGEAQVEAVRPGRMALPWGTLDLRRWPKQTYQNVQLIVLIVSACAVCFPYGKMSTVWRRLSTFVGCILLLAMIAIGTSATMLKHVQFKRSYFDYYDTYHYLLGARYFDELGYDQHYTCTALALKGEKRRHRAQKVRDLTNNRSITVDKKFYRGRHARRCRDSFSKERFAAFRSDVRWFRRWFGRSHWKIALRDHGYNGPPPLTALTRLLSDGVELTKVNVIYLGTINLVVLYGAAMASVWAFGWRMGLGWFALLWGCSVDKFNTIPAFIRYLWLASLVGSFCLMQRRRYGWSGALIALSGSLKIFPLAFLLPFALRGLLQLVQTKQLDRKYLQFFAGATLTLVVMLTLGWIYGGQLAGWQGFLEQMELNAGRFSSGRIGFVYHFIYPKETISALGSYAPRSEDFYRARFGPASLSHLRWLLALSFLALAGRASRKMNELTATIFLGFCLHFCLFNVVRYYYTAFLALPLMWFPFAGYGRGRSVGPAMLAVLWGGCVGRAATGRTNGGALRVQHVLASGLHRLHPPGGRLG